MRVRDDPGSAVLIETMGDEQRVVDAARVSIGGQKPNQKDEALLKYLWSNGHTSPFEHVTLTFRIECPIFTARQIMRHRTFSYNEMSGRYSELNLGYYMPRGLYTQSSTNKQGTELKTVEQESQLYFTYDNALAVAELDYRRLLDAGVAREQARMILPMATFTSFYMTGNLLNWIKFLKLRHEDHAQYEVWTIADDIVADVCENFPRIWEIVKEEIHGTERQLAESRHFARFVSEGRLGESRREDAEHASTYDSKVFEAVRSLASNWSPEGEA